MWPGPGVWFAGPVAGVPGGGGGRTLTRKTRIMIIFFLISKLPSGSVPCHHLSARIRSNWRDLCFLLA